ncbi:hypothetical protein SNE40_004891 [Patella caerulea]|uniref:Transmembrane protein 214-A n=1 Tax=Patella caerulea TaxID=87958 RepID=A0AAN8Q640_PATCE
MASEGKWETVPMKNKPNRVENQKSKKNQTKSFIENMPRIDPNQPLKTSKTAYDAFIDKQKDSGKTTTTLNNNQVENKKNKEKKEKPKTFEEASKKLEVNDIKSMVERSQGVKSTNPDAWIKELTLVFNNHFKHLPQSNLLLTDKPKNFPVSALTRECSDYLLSVLKQASTQTLEQVYFLTTQSMVNDSNKVCIYGYQIILQLLAKDNPGIIVPRLNQYLEIVFANKNKQKQCELVLWSLTQCSSLDMKVGLKAIVVDFLPAMRVKMAASYSIQYIEEFFRRFSNLSEGYGEISIKDYFQSLDLIYNSKTQIESEHQDRLNIQLNKIKVLAYGSDPKSNLRNFFPYYLSRIDSFAPSAQQNEYLSSIITCLSTDKQCFPAWCQLYTKHLLQSSVVLQYILEKYNTVAKKLPRKVLQQTIRSFSLTNEELAHGKGKNKKEGLERCTEVCKALQLKINQSGFPWKLLLFLMVTVVGCVIAYDINTSPSLKASRTMVLLEDYGVLAVTNQAWKRIQVFTKQTQAWLNVNAPLYRDNIVPYVTLAWNKITQMFIFIGDVTRPYILLLGDKLAQALQWFNTQYPNFWTQCSEYMTIAWTFIRHHSLCMWHCIVNYTLLSYAWLEKNVLVGQLSPENIQKTVIWSLQLARNYTLSAVAWCQQTLVSVSSS